MKQKSSFVSPICRPWLRLRMPTILAAMLLVTAADEASAVGPTLNDSPLFAGVVVPANVILDLSVEFPTAVGDAYASGSYSKDKEYVGYFNPNFCYDYVANSGSYAQTALFENLSGYFYPVVAASGRTCSGHWSGNLLNWVNTQTIDPLRKTMTGGARIVDTSSATVLQKAYQDSQSGGSNQNTKSITDSTLVSGATPFNWSSIYFYNRNTGLNFVFKQTTTSATSGTDFGTVTVASAQNGTGGCSSANTGNTTNVSTPSGNNSFALGDSPNGVTVTTTAGCSNTSSITIKSRKVSTGSVTLAAIISPATSGVVASFSPNPVSVSKTSTDSQSSTLTLTSLATAVAGNYTVTITGTSGTATPSSTTLSLTVAAPATISNTTTYQAQSAMQVCTSPELTGTYSEKEGNSYSATAADGSPITVNGRCRAYGTNYKPVGLMQKYAAESTSQNDTIRYAAFGYMLDSAGTTANQQLDGGVLRAKMKSVGPYKANPGQTVVPNSAKEWDSGTGVFFPNPDSTDASNTPAVTFGGTVNGPTNKANNPISRSGVANYLNLFGFVPTSQYTAATRAAYKRYDSVGELYYMALRYYRNLPNLATHTTTASAITSGEATNDNFPVIAWTTRDDPIAYSCSANYIVGIGDIHTWNDGNVPGSTLNGGNEVADASVTADTVVDAKAATNWIANLENLAKYTGAGTGGTTANNSVDIQDVTGLGGYFASTSSSPNAGSTIANTCCNGNTYLMAGLAYDAHVRDIRPDITNKSSPVTVSTFWLDVMESNEYREKNQFWLTAKYGGFNTSDKTAFGANGYPTATNGNPSTYPSSMQNTPLPTSSWNTGSYQDDRGNFAPDQYYQAGSPAKMASGLNSAFAKIGTTAPSGISSALGLSTNVITSSNNVNYVTGYNSDWSGSVFAQTLAVTYTGNVGTTTATPAWDASTWLPPTVATSTNGVLTYDTRKIATSTATGAGHGVPFRPNGTAGGGITSPQQTLLGASLDNQTSVLNYLRGDQCNESSTNMATAACQTLYGAGATSKGYRSRSTVLGDITNSKPAIYGAPSLPYADTPLNPGYSSFKTTNSSRTTMLYIGANDGMLHAFDGSVGGATSGKELFAYVPSALFTSNTDANGNPVGLASLVSSPLTHHFMVDAQPVVTDIDFNRVGLSTSDATWSTAASDWHTIVISGLGKGGGSNGTTVGGGYFALDVTDPAGMSNEATLKGKVLWETDPAVLTNMGYSYGEPLMIKTKKYGWTLVLTSGYGNIGGQGYIYLVNPKTGALYESPIATGAGSTTQPAGLAHITAFVPNQADFTADALYAGDLLGNVWRVDLTYTSGSASAEQIASLTASDNTKMSGATTAVQPVTVRPVIGVDPTSGTRYVFVGTGQLLSDGDLVNPQTQAFYALKDGTSNFGGFDVTSTFPITTDQLTVDDPTDTTTGASSKNGIPSTTLASASYRGFYVNMAAATNAGAGTQPSAERVNVQPVASGGTASFAANLYGQDICVKGNSRTFALNYDSGSGRGVGQSLLLDNNVPAGYTPFLKNPTGVVTNLALTSIQSSSTAGSAASGMALVIGYDNTAKNASAGSSSATVDVLGGNGAKIQRINWREVPSSN